MKEKIKNEFAILKSETKPIEYAFWWVCRIIMFTVLAEVFGKDNGGYYNLQIIVNTALLFVLPTLHLLPRKHCFLARLTYRAQTIASFMVIATCYAGVYKELYSETWYYDFFVHFLGGLLCVPAGIYLTDTMINKKEPFSPLMRSVAGFGLSCFTTLGWECYEFIFDWITGEATQHWYETPFSPFIKWFPTDPMRYPLFDTMTDLVAGLAGAIIGGIAARITYEHKKKK